MGVEYRFMYWMVKEMALALHTRLLVPRRRSLHLWHRLHILRP